MVQYGAGSRFLEAMKYSDWNGRKGKYGVLPTMRDIATPVDIIAEAISGPQATAIDLSSSTDAIRVGCSSVIANCRFPPLAAVRSTRYREIKRVLRIHVNEQTRAALKLDHDLGRTVSRNSGDAGSHKQFVQARGLFIERHLHLRINANQSVQLPQSTHSGSSLRGSRHHGRFSANASKCV